MRRDVWLLPQPVRIAPTAITGLLLFSMVFLCPSRVKSAPAAFTLAPRLITKLYGTSL